MPFNFGFCALSAKTRYEPTPQTVSHMGLNTRVGGEHHVTVPRHFPLRIGTLAAILADIAHHHGLSREALVERLFRT